MQTFKDDRGEPINEDAKSFLVMCPTVPIFSAFYTAINQNTLASGTTNVIANASQFSITPILNTRISDAGAGVFHFFRTDAPVKAFIRQQEGPFGITSQAEGSHIEHANHVWEFGVSASRNVGFGRWEYAVKATMS